MKATKPKKRVKKNKPEFVVDFSNVTCPEDVIIATMFAKVNQGKTITAKELDTLITKVVEITVGEIFSGANAAVINKDGSIERLTAVPYTEKKNIFKRFWNWVKRLFKKG